MLFGMLLDPTPTPVPTSACAPDDKICIKNNGDADFINLAWPLADTGLPSEDASPHDCTHAPLAEVVLP